MATKPEATRIGELEAKVSEINEGIAELSRRRDEAAATIERARKRFEELAGRRKVLSPMSFSGDEDATRELEALEDEHDALARSVRVAESALPEFERFIEEAEERRDAAEKQVHRARAEEMREELEKAEAKRDELAAQLVAALEDHARVFDDYRNAVSLYDRREAGRMGSDPRGAQARWLYDRLGRWLR